MLSNSNILTTHVKIKVYELPSGPTSLFRDCVIEEKTRQSYIYNYTI